MAELKKRFLEFINNQISRAAHIRTMAENANDMQSIDKTYADYSEWDKTNSVLLNKAIVVRQFHNMYDGRGNLENVYDDKDSFEYKRNKITKGVADKLYVLNIAEKSAQGYENKDFLPLPNEIVNSINNQIKSNMKKVFISHASADKHIISPLVYLLKEMGLSKDQIFYSSHPAYGVQPGENILERLKTQLNDTDLVLFVLSDNFYKSPVCLCEMGAVWIKTTNHIPILIPPFTYKDLKGAIPPNTISLKINDKSDINTLQHEIQKAFNTPNIHPTEWEERRDKYLSEVSANVIP